MKSYLSCFSVIILVKRKQAFLLQQSDMQLFCKFDQIISKESVQMKYM